MSPGPAVELGRREQTKVNNRAAILGAAREVFAELGYGAASVRDIVRRTDLAAGTFYNYFPDKESIFRALVEESVTEARSRVRAARAAADSLESFIENGFRAYYEFVAEDLGAFELMNRNAGTIRTIFDDPALGAGVEDLREDLEAAVARGDVPAVDVDLLAGAMTGVAFEVGVRMVSRDPVDVEAATRFTADVFLGAIERIARG